MVLKGTTSDMSKSDVFSNLMAYGEAPHHFFDLNLDLISNLRFRHKDHKSFDSGNAIPFASNVLNLDIILFSNLYGSGWSGSTHGRSFFASEQIFTVLREKP